MTPADWISVLTAVMVVVGALINAAMTHRVHVQFNSRFDQLLVAAEQRGAAIERASADLRDVAREKAESVADAEERRVIRAENKPVKPLADYLPKGK